MGLKGLRFGILMGLNAPLVSPKMSAPTEWVATLVRSLAPYLGEPRLPPWGRLNPSGGMTGVIGGNVGVGLYPGGIGGLYPEPDSPKIYVSAVDMGVDTLDGIVTNSVDLLVEDTVVCAGSDTNSVLSLDICFVCEDSLGYDIVVNSVALLLDGVSKYSGYNPMLTTLNPKMSFNDNPCIFASVISWGVNSYCLIIIACSD